MPLINADIVLCDIEGTTTSISFVKDILFPYAKCHSKDYIQRKCNEDTTKQIVADLIALPEYADFKNKSVNQDDNSVETTAEFVAYLIEKDLKLRPLKTLQGLIWNRAYTENIIKGHVYEDVPQAFEEWTKHGIQINIYSSGSVKAQQLLFGYSEFGNLMPYIKYYFDTEIGNKRDPKSYTSISQKLGVQSKTVLFLTDIIAEGKAAKETGMQVIILQRPGNEPLTDEERMEYIVVENFNEIIINKTSKI